MKQTSKLLETSQKTKGGKRPAGLVPAIAALGLLSCGVSGSSTSQSQQQEVSAVAAKSAAAVPAAASAIVPAGKLAFPGAQGFGAQSLGGRGGRIIPITTLADAGPGSFRACVTADGPRVCVFRVSGVIRFSTAPPVIKSPFLTIAGETAPGDGIILAHSGGAQGFTPLLIKNNHDVIIRHIRSRPNLLGLIAGANDAITIENSRNVILDHVSGSWARDENINGHRQNDNITISWSIFAEGLRPHDKCALLGSDPTGPQNFSFIGNLCAHTGDRNPDLNFTPLSCVEIINNIFYNANSQFAEIWESYGGTSANIVGNVFKAGPNTESGAIGIDRQRIGSTGPARLWVSNNQFDGSFVQQAPSLAQILVSQPVCPLSMTAQSPANAYTQVLQTAGTFPRDSFDRRIVGEVQSRTGRIMDVAGPMPILIGGAAYPDRDADGMSDAWESSNGTAIATADSWGDANQDGLSNLEAFLDYAHRRKVAGQPIF
jgi:pectate lyase